MYVLYKNHAPAEVGGDELNTAFYERVEVVGEPRLPFIAGGRDAQGNVWELRELPDQPEYEGQ